MGTLTVNGNLSFQSGSTYAVQITNIDGQTDWIHASGTATISGGTVDVLAGTGTYNTSNRYKLVTGDAGVSGTFSSLTTNLAFMNPQLEYDSNNVWLVFARNAVDLCSVAQTANQSGSCKGIDSQSDDNPVKQAILDQDEQHARDAYDQLSGEIHATAQTALLQDSRFPREAALERMGIAGCQMQADTQRQYNDGDERQRIRAQLGCGGDDQRNVAWGRVFGSWGHLNGDGNAAKMDRGIGGVFVGADTPVSDDWRIGMLGGYSGSNLNVKDRHSSADIQSWNLGIHAGGQGDGWGLRLGANESWNNIRTRRHVNFPGFSDTLTASYNGTTSQAFAELGYRITHNTTQVEPFANVAWVQVKTDGFSEQGGAAALTAAGQTATATLSSLGVHLSGNFDQDMGRMQLTLGWQHASGKTPSSELSYVSGSDSFNIAGLPLAKNLAVLDAGLDFSTSATGTLKLSYTGQFGSGIMDNGLQLTFRKRF
jgi:outer membrane autotransporter protein